MNGAVAAPFTHYAIRSTDSPSLLNLILPIEPAAEVDHFAAFTAEGVVNQRLGRVRMRIRGGPGVGSAVGSGRSGAREILGGFLKVGWRGDRFFADGTTHHGRSAG